MKLLLSAILLFNFSATFAKIVFLMGEKYEDCSTGGSYKFLDYSGLEYEYENDTAFFLTGDFKFLRKVASPLPFSVLVENFDRGKWHTSIMNRKGADFCPLVQSPAEPWYNFFSTFKQKNCPFEAGHVESFDRVKSFEVPDNIPFNFVGKYRCTTSFDFIVNGLPHSDCIRIGFELLEV